MNRVLKYLTYLYLLSMVARPVPPWFRSLPPLLSLLDFCLHDISLPSDLPFPLDPRPEDINSFPWFRDCILLLSCCELIMLSILSNSIFIGYIEGC
jgi:hypothetical protein